jgi:hypothetical protein
MRNDDAKHASFFCAWVDVLNAATRDGCAGYPVSAFTKTAGLITDIRRLVGSRTSGNEQLCLVSAMLHLPAVGASGLHRTPHSARYVDRSSNECIKSPLQRRGQLAKSWPRDPNPPCRGGLPRPPAITG